MTKDWLETEIDKAREDLEATPPEYQPTWFRRHKENET